MKNCGIDANDNQNRYQSIFKGLFVILVVLIDENDRLTQSVIVQLFGR